MSGFGGRKWWPDVLFVGGVVGLASEAVLHHDSPSVFLITAVYIPAIAVLPYVKGLEYVRRGGNGTPPSPPTSSPGAPTPPGPGSEVSSERAS